jgi:hypothetical protein
VIGVTSAEAGIDTTNMTESQVANISYREASISDSRSVAITHVRSWRESFVGIMPQTFLDTISVDKRAMAADALPLTEYGVDKTENDD